MTKQAKAVVRAALVALYRKDDAATSDTFQVAFDTSAPMIQAVMGAFADAVFSQMERRDAQKAYHGSKRAMAGLVHGQVDRLLTAKRDHAVRKRVSQFQEALDGFLGDLASKNNTDPEPLQRRFYKKLLAKFSEAGLNTDSLSIDLTPATASTQGTPSMKVTAQIIAANKASLSGSPRTQTTTAAPAAPMPDWLKGMSRKAQQRYFAENPDSKYNPNRKVRPSAVAPTVPHAAPHGINPPEQQQAIHKALSTPEAQAALQPGSPQRVKAAHNLKEMTKNLATLKAKNPKAYKDAATMAKRLLADDKPGLGYQVGSALGHHLLSAGYGGLGAATGLAAGSVVGLPLGASLSLAWGLGALFSLPSTIKGFRRTLGMGGKFTEYKNNLTKTTYDQAVKKGHIQESAAVADDDDRVLQAALMAAAETMEKGELTPEMLAQYGQLHQEAPAATASTRTNTTTAAPAAAMPDWLKRMGRKGQQRYFAANPNSRYNPNRVARPSQAPAPGAAPKAASGHGAMIAKHITPKNVGAVSSTVRKNASAGAAAATHVLDDETKKGAVGALQKIQDNQPLDGNDKRSLFKTALVGAAGAAAAGATLVGSVLLAPVLMSDPNMVHGTLNHIIDSVKNSGASQNFSDAAEKITGAAGEYIGKAGHFVSENSKDAAARAEKLLGPDTIQKLKEMKSSAGGAVDDATKWAKSGLDQVGKSAHDLYDSHIHPHLEKLSGAAKDAGDAVKNAADQVKDKVDTGVSNVKHVVRDAKEAISPTAPATNEQTREAIDKSGGEKPDYDKVTQKNTADPKLMDSEAPDNVQRHGGANHPMSDADYTKKIGDATKDAPGYNDKTPAVTTKGPVDVVTDAAKAAHDHVKKAASDAITHLHKQATDAINDATSTGEGVGKKLGDAVDNAQKTAGQMNSDLKTASKELGDKAWEGIKDAGNKVADTVNEGYEDLKNKGSAAAQGVKKGVSDWLIDKGLKKVDIK